MLMETFLASVVGEDHCYKSPNAHLKFLLNLRLDDLHGCSAAV